MLVSQPYRPVVGKASVFRMTCFQNLQGKTGWYVRSEGCLVRGAGKQLIRSVFNPSASCQPEAWLPPLAHARTPASPRPPCQGHPHSARESWTPADKIHAHHPRLLLPMALDLRLVDPGHLLWRALADVAHTASGAVRPGCQSVSTCSVPCCFLRISSTWRRCWFVSAHGSPSSSPPWSVESGGFACPQTVIIHLHVDREHIRGSHQNLAWLDKVGWGTQNWCAVVAKHMAWMVSAHIMWTGFTFVGYFTPIRPFGDRYLVAVCTGRWSAFWILFYGLFTYLNAGLVREKVCLHTKFPTGAFRAH